MVMVMVMVMMMMMMIVIMIMTVVSVEQRPGWDYAHEEKIFWLSKHGDLPLIHDLRNEWT